MLKKAVYSISFVNATGNNILISLCAVIGNILRMMVNYVNNCQLYIFIIIVTGALNISLPNLSQDSICEIQRGEMLIINNKPTHDHRVTWSVGLTCFYVNL